MMATSASAASSCTPVPTPHACTDSRGHLLGCVATGANAHDGPPAERVVAVAQASGFTTVTLALADGAYEHFADALAERGVELRCTTVPECKKLKANGFAPVPVRWVIERTFAHPSFSRAFRTCYDRLRRHYEATVLWAHVKLALRQLEKL